MRRPPTHPWHLCPTGALAALFLAAASATADPGYALGHGYSLPWFGLTARGYATLRAGSLEGVPDKASVQDLSLFLTSDLGPRWHFFTEVELSDPLVWTDGGFTASQATLDVERLYFDHNLSARATLRLGQYLTPIGRWNQVHADPLVWSVFRPLTTSAAFPRHASGLQAYGTMPVGEANLDWQVFADDSQSLAIGRGPEPTYLDAPIEPNPNNAFDHGGGGRLVYRVLDDALQVGLSAAAFELDWQSGTKDLAGLDLFYRRAGWELTGEAVYRRGSGINGNEWGGFAQVAIPIPRMPGVFAVLSGERFKAEGYSQTTAVSHLGLTYRPIPALSFKVETQESYGVEALAPDGWQLSVAVLF